MSLDFSEFSAHGVPIVDERRCLACTRLGWAEERRRDTYLLRPVPDVPLSVDQSVTSSMARCTHTASPSAIRLLAIALPSTAALRYVAEARRRHDFALPDTATFVGFDVADPGTSGLSNCGYGTVRQLESAKAAWSRSLNLHHLFEERSVADSFADYTDLRVPEHAPFLVVALYVAEP